MPFILDKFPTYESYAHASLTDIYSEDMLSKSTHKKLNTMSSRYLQNNGDGTFTASDLPIACQTGPVKSVCTTDINEDGLLDFMVAGNHFPTEVETARYDGLVKTICLGDGKGRFICKPLATDDKFPTEDIRSIKLIQAGDAVQFLIGVNDGPLQTLSIKR